MKPLLWPKPRFVARAAGSLEWGGRAELIATSERAAEIAPIRAAAAVWFDSALMPRVRGDAVTIQLADAPNAKERDSAAARGQRYDLQISAGGVVIRAAAPIGWWYGLQTLRQWRAASPHRAPCVRIQDWPDFPVRGVMLDISRDKVPTMATLQRLIDALAGLKYNQLQLYTEHTFAYRSHRAVWKDASPLTAAEVRELDRYCADRFIELVPNQNCFGHMERWLKHGRYAPLAEAQGPWVDPWGRTREKATTLNPLDPRSLRLVRSLLEELLPHFSSRMVNVGCDETFELGQGRSAEACRRRGVGRVYLDYIKQVFAAAQRLGRRPQFWADIIHQHPSLIRELPRAAIPLEWGYEADHPFDERCAALSKAGLEFYVCPGTSSWCSFSGRTRNAVENLRAAARAGLRYGATGYLVTDWGDYGHRQYLPASYGPLTFAAGAAWHLTAHHDADPAAAASMHFLGEPEETLSRWWLAAGDVYRRTGVMLKNQTILFRVMQAPLPGLVRPATSRDDVLAGLRPAALMATRRQLSKLRTRVGRFKTRAADTRLAARELVLTLDVLLHACDRASAVFAARRGRATRAVWRQLRTTLQYICGRHREVWLARNRPGGLTDSLAHFERNRREYGDALRGRPGVGMPQYHHWADTGDLLQPLAAQAVRSRRAIAKAVRVRAVPAPRAGDDVA